MHTQVISTPKDKEAAAKDPWPWKGTLDTPKTRKALRTNEK